MVRAIKGSVFDVVVDLRRTSKTFGKHYHLELSETNKTQLWIPPGMAHGFLALSDFAEVNVTKPVVRIVINGIKILKD